MSKEAALAAFFDPQQPIGPKGAATRDRARGGGPPAVGEPPLCRLQIDGAADELRALVDAVDDLARFNLGAVEWLREFAGRLRGQGVDALASYIEDQASQLAGASKIPGVSRRRARAHIETLRELAAKAGAPVHDPELGLAANSRSQTTSPASAVSAIATPANSADLEGDKVTSEASAQGPSDESIRSESAIAPGSPIYTENDMFFFGDAGP